MAEKLAASLSDLRSSALLNLHSAFNHTSRALGSYAEPYHDEIRMLGEVYGRLPYWVLLTGHCLFAAAMFRAPAIQRYWLIHFWLTFIAGFGGGTLSSILSQEPPAWFVNDIVLVLHFFAWWFVYHLPGGFGMAVYDLLPVKAFCHASANILKARTIIAKVDTAIDKFGRTSLVAPLVLGTLGGCGGRLLSDLASLAVDRVPTMEVAEPSLSLRSSFGSALLFVATVHWAPILPRDVSETLITTLLVARGLGSDLTGLPLDITYPFAYLFHAISGIPWPPKPRARNAAPRVVQSVTFESRAKRE